MQNSYLTEKDKLIARSSFEGAGAIFLAWIAFRAIGSFAHSILAGLLCAGLLSLFMAYKWSRQVSRSDRQ
jgi:hypothetical protein